jgi:hypothetical protein
VPVALVEVEAVPDEELVRHGEAHVAHREVVDEPPVGSVEEGDRGQRGGSAEGQRLADVVQRQSRVDDVLDEEDVAALDRRVQVFDQPNARSPACAPVVAGERDEVERVRDRDRAREVGDEEDARLERGDEERLAAFVVARNRSPELGDARADLGGREVELPDAVRAQLARSSLYRSARRWISRL